jgi:hypothetical protein
MRGRSEKWNETWREVVRVQCANVARPLCVWRVRRKGSFQRRYSVGDADSFTPWVLNRERID